MRVLVIGSTGTIGSAIEADLRAAGHDVVGASLTRADIHVDLSQPETISAMYEHAGSVDAVVCAAGVARHGPIQELDEEAYRASVHNKLLGQVELVRLGLGRVTVGGSFTLTSGTLSVEPTPGTSALAMTGAAVEGFARAVALDLDGRYRVNVVSPGWVAESRVASGLDPLPGIWARDLAVYYRRLVEGDESGAVHVAEEALS